MIGHELAQCRVIHAQGRVTGSQHKSSQKKIRCGEPVVPKQHKEYWKKDPQPTFVEDPIGNIIDVPGGTNAGSLLINLTPIKQM